MENELKQYELICILNPRLDGVELDNLKQDLEKNINQLNGKIIHFKDMVKRDLAYPINKQHQGIYLIIHVELNPEKIADLSKILKSNTQILRQIINYLETSKETEKPRTIKKPTQIKKFIKRDRPSSVKTAEDKIKLEEIDKKLDELVGL